MFSRRVEREVKMHRRDSFSAVPLRLITLLMFLSQTVFSQTNNQKYELNDPRNPDCPCHKLQKQAEDEYKQLQMKNNTDNQIALNVNKINVINDDNKSVIQANEGNDNFGAGLQRLSTSNFNSGGVKRKKSLLLLIQKKRNIYRIKHSKIKKFKIKTSDCFHWD
jgi:hypothetical protein